MSESVILMSTYNGQRYLQEQLNSLENQTYKNWDLFIRDDGSNDETVKIIKNYIMETNHQVRLIQDDFKLGPSSSFLCLLKISMSSNYKYYFFCDQDDVWKPQKMQISINKLINESKLKQNVPILVHTDLEVVNQNLKTIYSSMWQANQTNPKNNTEKNFLVENNVTGCTVVLNREACEIVINVSNSVKTDNIMMHDWWAALIVSIFGIVTHVNESTIYYRQHSNNTIGLNKQTLFFKFSKRFWSKKYKIIHQVIKQDQELNRYLLMIKFDDVNKRSIVKDYSSILNQSIVKKHQILKKYGIRKTNFLNNIGFKLLLFTNKSYEK